MPAPQGCVPFTMTQTAARVSHLPHHFGGIGATVTISIFSALSSVTGIAYGLRSRIENSMVERPSSVFMQV